MCRAKGYTAAVVYLSGLQRAKPRNSVFEISNNGSKYGITTIYSSILVEVGNHAAIHIEVGDLALIHCCDFYYDIDGNFYAKVLETGINRDFLTDIMSCRAKNAHLHTNNHHLQRNNACLHTNNSYLHGNNHHLQ